MDGQTDEKGFIGRRASNKIIDLEIQNNNADSIVIEITLNFQDFSFNKRQSN